MKYIILASLLMFGSTSVWGQKAAADLYGDKCAVCHGPDGAGKTARGRKLKIQPVSATIKKFKLEEMIKITTEGMGQDMPPYSKELSAAEIKAVVEYYRGLAK